MTHPTSPRDEGWFEWAEAETITRLRRQIAERRALRTAPPAEIVLDAPPPPPDVRLEEAPSRVIRVHQENLTSA